MKIPKSHPRHASLNTQEILVKGVKKGITSMNGLMAHGRGEAFDYLLGEKTTKYAVEAVEAAAALLLLSKKPVISVNGNTAILIPKECVRLSKALKAFLEVNIFHTSKKRERKIKAHLKTYNAKNILMPSSKYKLKYIDSNRRYVNKEGIYKADVVFVPLEDGDRSKALIKNKKKVITVDLNPMSRTSQTATITIADNIVRTMPLLISAIKKFKKYNAKKLEKIVKNYDNKKNLKNSLKLIKSNLK
jgi:4-phosphopantoate---beta-alanine ligase